MSSCKHPLDAQACLNQWPLEADFGVFELIMLQNQTFFSLDGYQCCEGNLTYTGLTPRQHDQANKLSKESVENNNSIYKQNRDQATYNKMKRYMSALKNAALAC